MFPCEHVKEVQFERNVQFYGICYHVAQGLNIYAISFTFISLEGKTRLTIFYFFPHLIMSSVLVHAGCYYKMPEAGWFINHVIYHSSEGSKFKIRIPAWLSE